MKQVFFAFILLSYFSPKAQDFLPKAQDRDLSFFTKTDIKTNTPDHDGKRIFEKLKNLILEKDFDVNKQDHRGDTLLHILSTKVISEEYDLKLIKILIQKGILINERNNRGETAFLKDCNFSNMGVVKLLLKHGANFYAKDNQGMSPINSVLKSIKFYRKQIPETKEKDIQKDFKELLENDRKLLEFLKNYEKRSKKHKRKKGLKLPKLPRKLFK